MNKTLLYIDFESAYETKKGGYGLKQMSMIEYIRDPRFKAFGLAWMTENGAPPTWVTG